MVAFAATAVGYFIELIYTALNPIAVLRCPQRVENRPLCIQEIRS